MEASRRDAIGLLTAAAASSVLSASRSPARRSRRRRSPTSCSSSWTTSAMANWASMAAGRRAARRRRASTSSPSEGLRLTNMNMEAQCTPSRSALLTGRYAIRSGTHSVPFGGVADGLTQWEVTMAEALSAAGYATALYGKWHLGSHDGRLPNDQGFDEWYGIPRTTDEALWPGSVGLLAEHHAAGTDHGGAQRREEPRREGLRRRAAPADRCRDHAAFDRVHGTPSASAEALLRLCDPHAAALADAAQSRRLQARPAMATGPTCWPRWITMSGRCSTRWTGSAFATTPL